MIIRFEYDHIKFKTEFCRDIKIQLSSIDLCLDSAISI